MLGETLSHCTGRGREKEGTQLPLGVQTHFVHHLVDLLESKHALADYSPGPVGDLEYMFLHIILGASINTNKNK
jgi:hypothetical protein